MCEICRQNPCNRTSGVFWRKDDSGGGGIDGTERKRIAILSRTKV